MLIYTIEIQDGEQRYSEWDYVDVDIQDYNTSGSTLSIEQDISPPTNGS
jgi:hypothetical protein